jgi:hypothetical protein
VDDGGERSLIRELTLGSHGQSRPFVVSRCAASNFGKALDNCEDQVCTQRRQREKEPIEKREDRRKERVREESRQ